MLKLKTTHWFFSIDLFILESMMLTIMFLKQISFIFTSISKTSNFFFCWSKLINLGLKQSFIHMHWPQLDTVISFHIQERTTLAQDFTAIYFKNAPVEQTFYYKMNKVWGSNVKMVTIVGNTALYNRNLLREQNLNVLRKKTEKCVKWWMC